MTFFEGLMLTIMLGCFLGAYLIKEHYDKKASGKDHATGDTR